jgi:hypothetical protein
MKILVGVLITLCLLVCIHQAHAETTTINQKGIGFISLSGGTVLLDENCVKIKLAKTLNDLGLKVAAVSVLCQDPKVWDAMEMSGSPCPMGGSVGQAAKKAWFQRNPERFKKLYGEDYNIPALPPTKE